MIRRAEESDIPRLVEMGQRFIAESPYKGRVASNRGALERLMRTLMAAPDALVLVSSRFGITGMIGVHIYTHPMSGERVAGELFWWVEPEFRGHGLELLKAAERWADEKDAVRVQMIAPTEKVARAYRALGYDRLEEHYQKDI